MKKEINRTLGNSLRCILPSFWWKRLLGKMVDKIESAENSASNAMKVASLAALEASDRQPRLVSGSNIKTINNQSILGSGNITVSTERMEKYKTKEELDAVGNTDGGEIAAVVDDVLVEKSFTECYQPTRSEIEANPYNAKFTKVDGLALNPDFNPNLISSNYGELSVMLYSDGKSKGYYKGYPIHLEIRCDYNRRIICWEYDDISGSGHTLYDSSGFNASNIDRVNNILREGNFRFSYFVVTYRKNVSDPGYTYYYSYNDTFPADATLINNVVKMLFAETQNADVYVRSSEWVRLLKEGDVTGGGADITIDSELSAESENPVQNKVIKSALDGVAPLYFLNDANAVKPFIDALLSKDSETNKHPRTVFATLIQGTLCYFYADAYRVYEENGNGIFSIEYNLNDKRYRRDYDFNTGEFIKEEEIAISNIDSELSDTSENPVQNKVITAALNEKQDKCINLINVGICNTFDELYDKLKDEQISLTIFLTGNIGGRIIINDKCVLMHVTDSYILIHTESASFASYRETQTIAVYDKNSNVCIGDKEHPVYSNWKEINVAALGSYVENSFPSFRVCYMINVENQSQLERKYSIHYPLSIERFPNSQVDFPEYYECVVYVNNTFERWRIYADGDIEKIS